MELDKVKIHKMGRARNPARTREDLIAAATGIFREAGYFATDSNAIARKAGYAPASFYKHFTDKADVLLAVYARYREEEWAGLQTAAQAAGPGQMRQLGAALDFLITFHQAWTRFRTDLRSVALLDPKVAEAIKAARREQLTRLSVLTGSNLERDAAPLLIILVLAERLSEVVAEGAALDVARADILRAAALSLSAALDIRVWGR
ncbi:MAG TPA: hypothetical protein DCL54_13815 [Alphaproteobacteria bacterium]|nr:hypothetical protein [Alphaproteobacteria bacterium]